MSLKDVEAKKELEKLLNDDCRLLTRYKQHDLYSKKMNLIIFIIILSWNDKTMSLNI